MVTILRRIWRLAVRVLSPTIWAIRRRTGFNSRYQLVASDVSLFCESIEIFHNTKTQLVILDVGSRHGLEAIQFLKRFPNAAIHCFEANPKALPELTQNVEPYPQIKVVPMAVNSFDGECDFYSINPDKTVTPWSDGNLGASSLFRVRDDVKIPGGERYVQDLIRVPCTRLDTYLASQGISRVDAIWMDLQGAELLALSTFPKSMFATLAVIQTELESQEIYRGQGLLHETADFLKSEGLLMSSSTPWRGAIGDDYIFLNSGLSRKACV